MADKFLTLMDITKRNNTDDAVGLIEEVNTVAPELAILSGRPISGTTYFSKKRSALPTRPAFRSANEGSDLVSSSYEQIINQCYFLDGIIQVDEAVVRAGIGEGNSAASILQDEATGVIRQKMIGVGDQFYRGTTADAKGFNGLLGLYDATNCEVANTSPTGSNNCSAWLIWNNLQGLHWIFGNNSGLNMGEWIRQKVIDSNSKSYMAYVNNLSGWLGLSFGHTRSIVRIKQIKNASTNYLTDALVAEALTKMPIFMRNDRANLRLFCNSTAALTLQKSRSTSVGSKTDALPLQFAAQPTESNGVSIVLTDSLPQTEA